MQALFPALVTVSLLYYYFFKICWSRKYKKHTLKFQALKVLSVINDSKTTLNLNATSLHRGFLTENVTFTSDKHVVTSTRVQQTQPKQTSWKRSIKNICEIRCGEMVFLLPQIDQCLITKVTPHQLN